MSSEGKDGGGASAVHLILVIVIMIVILMAFSGNRGAQTNPANATNVSRTFSSPIPPPPLPPSHLHPTTVGTTKSVENESSTVASSIAPPSFDGVRGRVRLDEVPRRAVQAVNEKSPNQHDKSNQSGKNTSTYSSHEKPSSTSTTQPSSSYPSRSSASRSPYRPAQSPLSPAALPRPQPTLPVPLGAGGVVGGGTGAVLSAATGTTTAVAGILSTSRRISPPTSTTTVRTDAFKDTPNTSHTDLDNDGDLKDGNLDSAFASKFLPKNVSLQTLSTHYGANVLARVKTIQNSRSRVNEYLRSLVNKPGERKFDNPSLRANSKSQIYAIDPNIMVAMFDGLAASVINDETFVLTKDAFDDLGRSLAGFIDFYKKGQSLDPSIDSMATSTETYDKIMIIVRTKIRSAFLRLLFNLHEYSSSNFRQVAFYDYTKEPFRKLLDDASLSWLILVRDSSNQDTAGVRTKTMSERERALEFDKFCKMLLQQLSHELIGFNCLTRFEGHDTSGADSYALSLLFIRYWQFVSIFRKSDQCCSKLATKFLTVVSRPMLAVAVHVLNDESSSQRLNAWAILVDLVLRQPRLVFGNKVDVVDALDAKLSDFFKKSLDPNRGRSMYALQFSSDNFLGRFPFPEEVSSSNLFHYLLYLLYRNDVTRAGKVGASFFNANDTFFEFHILDTKFVHHFDCTFVTEYLNYLLHDVDDDASTKMYERSYLSQSNVSTLPSTDKCSKSDRRHFDGIDAFSFAFLYMIFWNFRTFLTINQFDRPLAAIKENLFGKAGSVSFVVQNTMTCDLLAAEALYTFHLDITDPDKSASSSSAVTRRYNVFAQDFNDIGCNNEFWSSQMRSYSFVDHDYGTLRSSTVYSLPPAVLRSKHRKLGNINDALANLTYQQYLIVFCLFYNLREHELPTVPSIDSKFPKLVDKKSFDKKFTTATLLTFLQHHRDGNLSALIRLLELRRRLYYRARRQFFAMIEENGIDSSNFEDIDLLDESTLESDVVPDSELLFLRFVLTQHKIDVRKQVEFFLRPIHRKCERASVDDYFETPLHALRSIVANIVTSLWLKSNFPSIVADETKRNLKLRHKHFYEYAGALKKYVEVFCSEAREPGNLLERYKDVDLGLTTTFLAMQTANLPELVVTKSLSAASAKSPRLLQIITGARFIQSWRLAVAFIPTLEISQTFHEIPNVDSNVYAVFLDSVKSANSTTSPSSDYNLREVTIPGVNDKNPRRLPTRHVAAINFAKQSEVSSSVRFFATSRDRRDGNRCFAEIDCICDDPTVSAVVVANRASCGGSENKTHTVLRLVVSLTRFTVLNFYYPRFVVNSSSMSNSLASVTSPALPASSAHPISSGLPSSNRNAKSNLYATDKGTCVIKDAARSSTDKSFLTLNINSVNDNDEHISFVYPNILSSYYHEKTPFYVNDFVHKTSSSRPASEWSINEMSHYLSSRSSTTPLSSKSFDPTSSPSHFKLVRFLHRVRRKLPTLPWANDTNKSRQTAT